MRTRKQLEEKPAETERNFNHMAYRQVIRQVAAEIERPSLPAERQLRPTEDKLILEREAL
jgi:hypothetical protein